MRLLVLVMAVILVLSGCSPENTSFKSKRKIKPQNPVENTEDIVKEKVVSKENVSRSEDISDRKANLKVPEK